MLRLSLKRPVLSSLALSGLSLAGCGSTHEIAERPHDTPTSNPTTAANVAEPLPTASAAIVPERKDPGIDLAAEVSAREVTSERLGFKVLYSWTTDAQLDELVKGDPLLTRVVSKKKGMSMFDDLVAAEAGRGRDVAKLLWHEGFAKKRFAWPSPYSGLRGGDADGSYGSVLLRIELRPDAWILDYDRGVVHALDGARHTPDELKQHPERLAAVFHNGPGFREFIIVNEGMVARVDGGRSKAARAAIASDIELLQALAAHIEDDPGDTALPQLFPRSNMFQENLSSLEMRKRAKALDGIRGLPQASFEREMAANVAPEKVAQAFTLGPARAQVAPFCKLVRREAKQQPVYRGSFAMPRAASTTYSAVCEDPGGASPASGCVASTSATASDAVCTPVPTFGQ